MLGKMWAAYGGSFAPPSEEQLGGVVANWTADFHPADFGASFIVAMPLLQSVGSIQIFRVVTGISAWVQNGFPVGPLPLGSWVDWQDGVGFTSITFSLYLEGGIVQGFQNISAEAMGIVEFWE